MAPGPGEIIVIALVILLLFGFKKLPDAARSLGKSARVFKAEVNEMQEEDRAREEAKAKREAERSVGPNTAAPGETTTGSAMIDDVSPKTDNGPKA